MGWSGIGVRPLLTGREESTIGWITFVVTRRPEAKLGVLFKFSVALKFKDVFAGLPIPTLVRFTG